MNSAHFHLMLVHIPIVLVPVGMILLFIGIRRDATTIKLVALNLFIAATVFCVAAFLLGEGAEEAVEHLAGILESTIEDHEDSATIALWLTVALGVISIASEFAIKFRAPVLKFLLPSTLLLSVITSGTLAYTGQEGGKIRHPEAFNDSQGSASETPRKEKEEEERDDD